MGRNGKPSVVHIQFWRIVDGALKMALEAHPEYVPPGISPKIMRTSLTKRVTGALMSYAGVRVGMEPDGHDAGG